jgi:hypothetical protein
MFYTVKEEQHIVLASINTIFKTVTKSSTTPLICIYHVFENAASYLQGYGAIKISKVLS